jgi:hypothetical protein
MYIANDSVTTAFRQVIEPFLLPGEDAIVDDPEPVIASIDINGDRRAEVTLRTTQGAVRRVAAVMFGLEPMEITEADVTDALAELTNMTAGAMKSLLPGVRELGLPRVGDVGTDELPEVADVDVTEVGDRVWIRIAADVD